MQEKKQEMQEKKPGGKEPRCNHTIYPQRTRWPVLLLDLHGHWTREGVDDEELSRAESASRTDVEAEGSAGWTRRTRRRSHEALLGRTHFHQHALDRMELLQQGFLRRIGVGERTKSESAGLLVGGFYLGWGVANRAGTKGIKRS